MSRCFPFPPPGYERKTTIDNTEPLTKENCQEKKDKKEKRDREKREGKERKQKHKSKEKHKEKKDRKEKDRNKKDKDRHKTKDKDRNKDKNGTSSNKVPQEQNSHHHFDNHGELSQKAGPSKDPKSNDSMDIRIREREAANHMVECVANMPLARNAGVGMVVEREREPDAKMDRHCPEKKISSVGRMLLEGAVNNSMVNNFVQQNRNIGADGVEKDRTTDAKMERHPSSNEGRAGALGNKLVERATSSNVVNFIRAEQTRHIGTGELAEKNRKTDTKMDRDHITNQKGTKVGGNLQEGANGNIMGGNNIIAQRRRDDGASRLVEERRLHGKNEKDSNKQIKQMEKTKAMEVNAKKEQHKDKDQDKNNRKKDSDKKKKKKKETDKIMEKSEDKEHNIIGTGKKEQDASSFMHLFPPQDSTVKCASFDGNPKRKQINGFLHENDFQPNKMHKTASFSHLPVENGRKLETRQLTTSCTSDWHGAVSNTVLERATENKGHKTNGVVKTQLPHTHTLETITTDVCKASESSVKPHPDLKYLGQILSVPEMKEWSETIDQEWLLGNDERGRKSSGKITATETSQVWSKALKIDEADVLALPYVIPY